MKKLLFVLILFIGVFANAQNLTAEQKAAVTSFVDAIKNNDKQKIAGLVAYPLQRQYPVPSVKNQKELLKRFDEVFDSKLVSMIKASDIDKDWSVAGWRGIMFHDGEVWLDEDNRLTTVNYESPAEKKIRESLIAAEKKTLHASIKEFKEPVLIMLTAKYRIRIDLMADGTYRYASWKLSDKMSNKPDLVLTGGEFVADGSANYHYSFKTGEYEYNCGIMVVGAEDTPPAYLTVYKDVAEIVSEAATLVEP